MALFKLNAQVKIGPTFPAITDISDFIISIRRDYSICDFTQHFTLEVEPILWRNLVKAGVELNPGTCIEIYEYGVKVLTGFFNRVTRARKPANTDTLEGQDTYKLAMDFFNDNDTETAHGETVDYWSETLLTRCGLNYISDNPKAGLRTVPIGTDFGFKTIHECLVTLAAYAAGYYYVDSGGNIRLSKGRAPGVPDIRIVGGPVPEYPLSMPSQLYSSISGGGSIFGGYSTTNDELTRNRAIVWGWYGPDVILPSGTTSTFIKADVIKDMSLPVTRTVLYASPAIQSQNTALALATDITNQLGNFTDIVAWDVQGNPDFRVGGRIYHNNNFTSGSATGTPFVRLATTVNSLLDREGYTSHIRVGERCPRFAGWDAPSLINALRGLIMLVNHFHIGNQLQIVYCGDFSVDGQPTWTKLDFPSNWKEPVVNADQYDTGISVTPDGTRLLLTGYRTDDNKTTIWECTNWTEIKGNPTPPSPTWVERVIWDVTTINGEVVTYLLTLSTGQGEFDSDNVFRFTYSSSGIRYIGAIAIDGSLSRTAPAHSNTNLGVGIDCQNDINNVGGTSYLRDIDGTVLFSFGDITFGSFEMSSPYRNMLGGKAVTGCIHKPAGTSYYSISSSAGFFDLFVSPGNGKIIFGGTPKSTIVMATTSRGSESWRSIDGGDSWSAWSTWGFGKLIGSKIDEDEGVVWGRYDEVTSGNVPVRLYDPSGTVLSDLTGNWWTEIFVASTNTAIMSMRGWYNLLT